MKRIFLTFIAIIFVTGLFAQTDGTGTGWSRERKKVNFRDSTYFTIAPTIATGQSLDLHDLVSYKTDTSLYFAPNIGMGNAGDTILFSWHDIPFRVPWDGSDTLVITSVKGVGPTGINIDINLYKATDISSGSPTQMLTSNLTIISTTTGSVATAFDDADLAPGDFMYIRVEECTSQPTWCLIGIYGYLK